MPVTSPDSLPEPATSVRLTHPERLLWPDVGLTKQELAAFYAAIAEWALPHLAGRPLSFVRCPAGVGQDCFVQKHAWAGMRPAIRRHTIGTEEVLVIHTLEGLIALVQASVLEIHLWGARIDAPEQPDRVTIDLDPAEDVAWPSVIEVRKCAVPGARSA